MHKTVSVPKLVFERLPTTAVEDYERLKHYREFYRSNSNQIRQDASDAASWAAEGADYFYYEPEVASQEISDDVMPSNPLEVGK